MLFIVFTFQNFLQGSQKYFAILGKYCQYHLSILKISFICQLLTMASFPTILIPAYEFHFNLVVCPLPKEEVKTVSLTTFKVLFVNIIFLRVKASFLS